MDWYWHWRLSRQFRRVWLIGLSLLFLIGGLPYFISIPSLQKAFQHAVIQSTQRTFQAEDGAYFVLLPRPAIIFKKVALSEQDSHKVFLKADQLKLELDLLPLFGGKKQADMIGLTFKNAKFTVIRAEDASYNFDNLFNAHSYSPYLTLALKSINFNESCLYFIDKESKHTLDIKNLNLGLNDLDDPKSGNLQLKGDLALDPQQTWKGNITGSAALRLDRAQHILQVANLDINIAQHYAHTTPEDWNTGVFHIQGNLHYGWQPLRLSGGNLTFKSHAERADQTWKTEVTIPLFHATHGTLTIDHALINSHMTQGTSSLTSKAEIHHLFGTQKDLALQAKNAHIHIQFKQPSQTLQLFFKSALNVSGKETITLPQFHVTGNYHHQLLPRGALTFSQTGYTTVNFEDETLALKSTGLLDQAPMTIDINILNFFNPSYRFSANLSRLDLTPYLPAALEGAKTLSQSEENFDFSWLEALKAEGMIHIGRLMLQRAEMRHVQLGFYARDNILEVSPLSASIYQGNMTGKLKINHQGKTPQIQLKQRFDQVDIRPLFKDLFRLTRFDGKGYLDVDIAVAGNNRREWQRTMGGTMDLKVAQGTFRGLDILEQLRHTEKEIYLNINTVVNPLALFEKPHISTDFSYLAATFFIQKGIVYNKDLDIHTSLLHFTGEGNYDIKGSALDYTVKAKITPGSSTKEFKPLTGYTFPIHFTGRLQNPQYQIDYSSLRQAMEKQQTATPQPVKTISEQ